MQVNSALNSAMLGYQRANEGLESAAQNIAVATTNNSTPVSAIANAEQIITPPPSRDNIDVNTELLTMNTALYNGMASLKVIDTADEIIGTSIDVSV